MTSVSKSLCTVFSESVAWSRSTAAEQKAAADEMTRQAHELGLGC